MSGGGAGGGSFWGAGGASFLGRWCLGRAVEGTSAVWGLHAAPRAQHLYSRGVFSPEGIVGDGSFGRADARCPVPVS